MALKVGKMMVKNKINGYNQSWKCPEFQFYYVPLIRGAGRWDNFFQWEKKDHCVVK